MTRSWPFGGEATVFAADAINVGRTDDIVVTCPQLSFFGPHARERALQEREELTQLLNAVASDDPSDRDGEAHPFRPVQELYIAVAYGHVARG